MRNYFAIPGVPPTNTPKKYVIVQWPATQELMEYEWFQAECHLINDENGLNTYGSSAYFVPEDRLNQAEENNRQLATDDLCI